MLINGKSLITYNFANIYIFSINLIFFQCVVDTNIIESVSLRDNFQCDQNRRKESFSQFFVEIKKPKKHNQ